MALQDFMKRIINDVFLNYEWTERMPEGEVVNPAMSDVYVDQCSARCAADMMEKVETAMAADGRGAQLTEGERKLVHFKILESCRAHCERSIEMDIEQQNVAEDILTGSFLEDDSYGDRSAEDYVENTASESAVQPEIDGINALTGEGLNRKTDNPANDLCPMWMPSEEDASLSWVVPGRGLILAEGW